jgi:hypothetical protein
MVTPGGWYALSSGPMRLIVLNTNLPALPSSPQTTWLTQELSSPESKAAVFRVVLLHVPPFVTHWDKAAWANGDGTASEGIRRHWVPLFERHHVDLVISGHSHIYQRGMLNKVMYTIIGGGGGALETEQVWFVAFMLPIVCSFALGSECNTHAYIHIAREGCTHHPLAMTYGCTFVSMCV